MHETFRMMGEQHEADLEREATKHHLAAAVGRPRRSRNRARGGISKTDAGLHSIVPGVRSRWRTVFGRTS